MPRHDEGFFTAHDNLRLFWESDAPEVAPRAVVGLVHGFGDHIGRYRALRDALLKEGLAVHGMDFRGHGQSDGRRCHVDAFSEYVDDLERFVARLKAAAQGKPVFLLAHSNGALVSLLWLAERRPEGLAGLILSSAYLELAFKPPAVKLAASRLLNRLWPTLALGNELKLEDLSRDPAWQAATGKDPLYGRTVTPRWFTESLKAQARVRAGADAIRLPVLMLAGAQDAIASPRRMRAFFEALGSPDKQYKEYPGMRHEILNELGKEEVWQDVVRWISMHL